MDGPAGACHLDYAQKVFEVGPRGSHIGMVTWGLGQIGDDSHRTVAASLGFEHSVKPFPCMAEMANRLVQELWTKYTQTYSSLITRVSELIAKETAQEITDSEREELQNLVQSGSGGYCLAGRVAEFGVCTAYEILWGPHLKTPEVRQIPAEAPVFWGVPQIMERLVFGFDSPIIHAILQSGKWSGTQSELVDLVLENQLIFPRLLPIREAIDWVHTVIHTTIRGTKFANWPHWCGGPVEIATITTDRPFRWVRHKTLDAAIVNAERHGYEQPISSHR